MFKIGSGEGIGWTGRRALQASCERFGEVVVMRLEGKISIAGGDEVLRSLVIEALARGERNLLLNLNEVKLVDSSGVGELVAAYYAAKNAGGRVRLCCLSDRVFDVLRIVQLIKFFEVNLDEKGGLAAFGVEAPA